MTPPPEASGGAAEEVRDLARRAALVDGVEPLSEAFLLDLAGDHVEHHTRTADGGCIVGYAQRRSDGSAELVVDPQHRRRGHGRALLSAVLARPGTRVWAHGDLPAARALAAAAGLTAVRRLHLMGQPLTAEDAAGSALPEGFSLRPFRVGEDEDAWVATNAAAFAHHPEQGALTRHDLETRMRQRWFDADGLLLVEAVAPAGEGERPGLAAFHWTKREPGSDVGEVYVLGVHPAYQGRGLAGPLTALGLAHLARQGATEVRLYVDGDNAPALATYRRAGFTDLSVDVMYAAAPAGAEAGASPAG